MGKRDKPLFDIEKGGSDQTSDQFEVEEYPLEGVRPWMESPDETSEGSSPGSVSQDVVLNYEESAFICVDLAAATGEYRPDGTVQEPRASILTGKLLPPVGTVRERIPDTPYFYRFEPEQAHRVTDELRALWREAIVSSHQAD